MSTVPIGETPHSEEDQRAVLGSSMMNLRCIDVATEMGITDEHFFGEGEQDVWHALCDLHADPPSGLDHIDPVVLHERMKANGKPSSFGGLLGLQHLHTNTASTANIKYHCTVLLQYKTRRDLMTLGEEMVHRSLDPANQPNDLVAEMDSAVLRMHSSSDTGLLTMGDAVTDTYAYVEENKGREGPLGVSSGFPDLDYYTNGFKPGESIVVGGRPSEGKSALAWQMAEHVARRHGPVAFFSLEMDSRQLVLRSIARHLQMDAKAVGNGRIPGNKIEEYQAAHDELIGLPLYIDTRGGCTVTEIRSRARRLHRQSPLKLVIIDYLQLIAVSRAANREQEVATISRNIKALAMELQVPVLSLAQLNRQIEFRSGNGARPQLADLRDSGQIEQDADIVAFIFHPFKHSIQDSQPDRAELLVRKNRQGSCGIAPLVWRESCATFYSAPNSNAMAA